ncbi:UNVERIFIED_CONTAM: hypothetical protein HDU68_008980 [Siphonaria sp. JEL0065]|nr:hypothetical protein HDU68_008980 [Siphonaria sp. JEL0065]
MSLSKLGFLAFLAANGYARPNTQSAAMKIKPVLGVIIPEWQGFGTSLAWWACESGTSSMESTYADLFFTSKTTTITVNGNSVALPGLDLNIVRYNIGGTGRLNDYPGVTEYYKNTTMPEPEWWKLVEGFWVNGASDASSNWDWTRDANQRSMLKAAVSRNVNIVEFFSNAPMWWMTNEKSSLGGTLTNDGFALFPQYVATVVNQAISDWKIDVTSVSILNEPSNVFWNYPSISQEGLNIGTNAEKVMLLKNLRARLNDYNLTTVGVSGPEDYNYDTAFANLGDLLPEVGQVNVHGYQNKNSVRGKLHAAIGNTPLWMSEYGDPDNRGINMATAILNDINILQPTAWIYWQLLEKQVWGMLYASNFGTSSTDSARAIVTDVTSKYFVFAQFTRFIRPGDEILNSGHSNVVLAHNKKADTYKFVIVNYRSSQTLTINLNAIPKTLPKDVTITYTNTDGSALFGQFAAAVNNKKVVFTANKNSIYSLEI